MKIALCLSGQPRSVEAAFPFIEQNILFPNKPDVFIHSWIDDNIKGKRPVAAGGEVASDTIPSNVEDIILDLYHPKSYLFEPQIIFDELNYNERKAQFIRPRSSLSQRYSVKKAFELCSTFESYDAVIRMRFDWGIQIPIEVEKLEMDRVYLPNDCPHHGGYNDQFAIGNMTHMAVYSTLFDNINYLYNGPEKVPFVDEVMLGYHLSAHQVRVEPTLIPYKIIRYSGDPNIKHSEDYIV